MFKHFIAWIYSLFYQWVYAKQIELPPEKSHDLVVAASEIVEEINNLPESILTAGLFDDLLYQSVNQKFINFGQLYTNLNLIVEILDEYIKKPVLEPTMQDLIVMSDLGYKDIKLAHFQVMNGQEITISESVELIKKHAIRLVLLYTQIGQHPDVQDYYVGFLSRRTIPVLVDIKRYVHNLHS